MHTITIQKIVALVLAALAVFIIAEGMTLSYYGRFGPGSGFLPIWVGGLLLVLSLILAVQSFRAADDGTLFLPGQGTYKRPLALAIACLLVLPALPLFGFRLTMFVFVLLVPAILERQRWPWAIAIAAIASFGIAAIFEGVLLVRLPHAAIAGLSHLGL